MPTTLKITVFYTPKRCRVFTHKFTSLSEALTIADSLSSVVEALYPNVYAFRYTFSVLNDEFDK